MGSNILGATPLALMAAALLSIGHAHAQGSETDATRWRGFYVGGEVGAAWSSYSWSTTPNYFNTQGPTLLGSELTAGQGGFAGGAFGGYSWIIGPAVLGLEAAVRGGSLSKSQPTPWYPATDVATSDVHWMASAVARAGYAWQRWQFFGKAGWAGASAGFTLTDTGTGITSTTQKWVNGWTAGLGIQYMAFDRVSVGVTWDYTDLSASGIGSSCPGCGSGVGLGTPVLDTHLRLNAVMARFTFHAGP
ncbi:outer membrane protein [Reyranella sp.]|uniref:outer membrane protein n=1 Tax=Reyranella sp. TaxID=1929291 RepID=UPI003784C183